MQGYDFDRQKPINNYIIDFYCKELQLAIEIDGESHATKKERDSILNGLGVVVLRFEDLVVIYDTESVLNQIEDWIIKNK